MLCLLIDASVTQVANVHNPYFYLGCSLRRSETVKKYVDTNTYIEVWNK